MPLRLLLVRHGLSSFNKERRIQGRDDLSNLSEEGHEQARALGRSLQDVSIQAVYSSPCSGRLRRRRACWRPKAARPQIPSLMTDCWKWILSPGPARPSTS